VVVYLTKNSEAQQFCSSQWSGKIVWVKNLCGECPLHDKCSNPPVMPGIVAYTEWMNGINEEAARISIGVVPGGEVKRAPGGGGENFGVVPQE